LRRRDPLPIKIKAEHHLSSLLAEGSATDLTVVAFEGEARLPRSQPFSQQPGRGGLGEAAEVVPVTGIPDGISEGIPVILSNSKKKKILRKKGLYHHEASPADLPYVHLDATRTPNEQKLYSNVLRDLRKRASEFEPLYGKNAGRYGYSDLLRLTGIRSKTTLRVAIEGLLIKEDLEILSRDKIGTVYRIREPKEILEARETKQVRIDPASKWIYSKEGRLIDWADHLKRITGEARSVSILSSLAAREARLEGSSGISSGTPSDIPPDIPDGIPDSDTPVYQNLIHNNLNILNKAAASRLTNISSNIETDDDDDAAHRAAVISMYERYTTNTWRPSDDQEYKKVKHLLLETIEAGIISSILRCPTKVNSFSYCLGAILEFADFLPPGYVLYLRKKLRDKQEFPKGTSEPKRSPMA